MRSVHTHHPSADVVPLARFGLHDVETLRLVLRGSSVIDWVSLHFRSDEEIDAFIRVNELDPNDYQDRLRLLDLKRRAIDYLQSHLRYRVPEVVREADDVRALFRFASQRKGRRAYRFYACLALKVMHIMHHADAAELLVNLPLSSAEIHVLVQGKIERVVRGLLERSFPMRDFSGSRKTKNSVMSKLLAKKETQSTQIFDKLRFRLSVERREDIPPLILALSRELVPFNYLVPSQTHNSLIELDAMLVRSGNALAIRPEDELEFTLNEPRVIEVSGERRNEFSGPDYRIVNFVADVPLRVDRVLPRFDKKFRELGPVIFHTVEFQIVDRKTSKKNETGENRHQLYKARQMVQVKRRLEAGSRWKRGAKGSA